jgi:hypothetical protein
MSINPISSQLYFKGNDKEKYDSYFLKFSKNPIIDAGVWGTAVGIVGAGVDYFSQKSEMKNPEKLKLLIENSQFQADNPSITKRLLKTLKSYEAGKVDWSKVGRTAFLFGVILTFLPQLFLNYVLPQKRSDAKQINNNQQ